MKTALKVLVIAIVYALAGVLMYRQHVVSGGSPWNSDFLIFYLPAAIALVANGWAISAALPSNWSPEARGAATSAFALLVTFLSMVAYAIVALNMYGS